MELSDIGRLALALLLGGAIGAERRWHGHPAGAHTNALVAFGGALFVLIGVELGGEAAGRVASQVATGIGFLAGGVILREGIQVRGLNTAATIWCVAAIGALVGIREIGLATAATALLIIGNLIFHVLEHRFHFLQETDDAPDKRTDRKP